ncbi:jg140, partial [Pararge aegeria aegeria]
QGSAAAAAAPAPGKGKAHSKPAVPCNVIEVTTNESQA